MPRPSLRLQHRRVVVLAIAVSILASLSRPGPAAADWPSNPGVNLPVCTASNLQFTPDVAPSGSGGAIITWHDFRNGSDYDIYAERVLANGTLDPAWPANGRGVYVASGAQTSPRIVSDGSGGAIIVFQDLSGGLTSDLRAQHVLENGQVDANWPANGLTVCAAAGNQSVPARGIVTDEVGGAFVVWMDARGDTSVYLQHVLANGTLDPAWPANGLSLGAVADYRKTASLCEDGMGGAIVAWADHRGGSTFDLYAQHVLSQGALDPAWPSAGLPVCTAANDQSAPDVVTDGSGGAIVSWQDSRSGDLDVYAQHVLAGGAVDPTWPTDGRAVCEVAGTQQSPRLVSDRSGGAIVVWQDLRIAADQNIYAGHVLSTGLLDPDWIATGQVVCSATGAQPNVSPVSDGAGGAVVVWDDRRAGSGNLDVYAQHLLPAGGVDGGWPANGQALSNATGSQNAPVAIADGSGGAIVAWIDSRTFASSMNDIYAQRVQANGQLGGTVVGVPESGGAAFALDRVWPNPSRGGDLSVRFSLADESRVVVDLLDVAGRRLGTRDLGLLGAGKHSASIGTSLHGHRPGLYFLRVSAGSSTRTARIAFVN